MSDNQDDPKPIAIIGGGFAGTTALIQLLLRVAEDDRIVKPVKVIQVERVQEQLHGGVAYSKGASYTQHNLNAGAYSMDMFPGNAPPAGMPSFIEYIKMRAAEDPKVMDALINPPRQMVHDYLDHMLGLAIERAGSKAIVDTQMKRAIHVTPHQENGGCDIAFDDGTSVDARRMILATGFQEAVAPRFASAVVDHERFMDKPYSSKANAFYDTVIARSKEISEHNKAAIAAGKPEDVLPPLKVLVIGTGLTAMDIDARLIHSGIATDGIKIDNVSRRSLFHKSYKPVSPDEYLTEGHMRGEARPVEQLSFSNERPKFLDAPNVAELVKGVVSEFNDLRAQGYTSPEILMCWERWVPEVAAKFPQKDLADLFRKNDALITSLRVGVTPNTGLAVEDGIKSGLITVISGGVSNVQPNADGTLAVTMGSTDAPVSRHQAEFGAAASRPEVENYDYVFSAMGNTINYGIPVDALKKLDPLWAGLIEEGHAKPHWLGAGIEVSRDFSLVDKDGATSDSISVIGASVAGHMIVTPYPYPHRPDVEGGKLGPNALGAMTIAAEVKMLMDAKYDDFTAECRNDNAGQVLEPVKETVRKTATQKMGL